MLLCVCCEQMQKVCLLSNMPFACVYLLGLDGEILGPADLSCYVQDPNFAYQDFAQRDENQTQIFRVQVGFAAAACLGGA